MNAFKLFGLFLLSCSFYVVSWIMHLNLFWEDTSWDAVATIVALTASYAAWTKIYDYSRALAVLMFFICLINVVLEVIFWFRDITPTHDEVSSYLRAVLIFVYIVWGVLLFVSARRRSDEYRVNTFDITIQGVIYLLLACFLPIIAWPIHFNALWNNWIMDAVAAVVGIVLFFIFWSRFVESFGYFLYYKGFRILLAIFVGSFILEVILWIAGVTPIEDGYEIAQWGLLAFYVFAFFHMVFYFALYGVTLCGPDPVEAE